MNGRELDEYLKKGKKESEKFFAQVQFSSLRKILLHKVSHPQTNKARKSRFSFFRAGVAAACIILAVSVYFIINSGIRQKDITKTVLSEQSVPLNIGNYQYMISFNPVFQPKVSEPGLMSILWKYNHSDTPEMVYNSLFEKSDRPYPISVLGFPGDTTSKILLISSGSSKESYIHYRLVELYKNSLSTLWSQDFVPEGKLGIQNGIVVEQRLTQVSMPQTSYFIPYRLEKNGAICLPLEILHIHVGDRIVFIGEAGNQLETLSKNEKLSKANLKDQEQIAVFEADSTGADVILLGDGNAKTKQLLTLQITE